jgi:PEP-CTERM motif
MTSKALKAFASASLVSCAALAAPAANAALVLNADGINLGFSLSTIVSSFPQSIIVGSALNSDGNIMVTGHQSGLIHVYANSDNQSYASALSTGSYSGFATGMASVNGVVYAGGGALRKLNNDGTVAATYSSITISQGMWTNSVSGKILAVGSFSGGNGIIEIDVSGATPSARLVSSSFGADGITVSIDGQFVYTSSGYKVNIATGVGTSVFSVSGADGMGVISSSNANLNGDIVVNTTNGRLVIVDGVTYAQTVIATGGGYGDYTGVDTANGTLMFGSGSIFYRLGCGAGCGIGVDPPPSNNVPLPSSLALLGLGLFGLSRVRKSVAAK